MNRALTCGLILSVAMLFLCESRIASADQGALDKTRDDAILWAVKQLGEEVQPGQWTPTRSDYDLALVRPDGKLRWFYYCTRFVRIAYGQEGNWSNADALRSAAGAALKTSGSPTHGALVFWRWGKQGHIGIHVANGHVVHTGASSKGMQRGIVLEKIEAITSQLTSKDKQSPYVGWVDPTASPLAWGTTKAKRTEVGHSKPSDGRLFLFDMLRKLPPPAGALPDKDGRFDEFSRIKFRRWTTEVRSAVRKAKTRPMVRMRRAVGRVTIGETTKPNTFSIRATPDNNGSNLSWNVAVPWLPSKLKIEVTATDALGWGDLDLWTARVGDVREDVARRYKSLEGGLGEWEIEISHVVGIHTDGKTFTARVQIARVSLVGAEARAK